MPDDLHQNEERASSFSHNYEKQLEGFKDLSKSSLDSIPLDL